MGLLIKDLFTSSTFHHAMTVTKTIVSWLRIRFQYWRLTSRFPNVCMSTWLFYLARGIFWYLLYLVSNMIKPYFRLQPILYPMYSTACSASPRLWDSSAVDPVKSWWISTVFVHDLKPYKTHFSHCLDIFLTQTRHFASTKTQSKAKFCQWSDCVLEGIR